MNQIISGNQVGNLFSSIAGCVCVCVLPTRGSPFRLGCFFDFPFILFVSFLFYFYLCFYMFSYYFVFVLFLFLFLFLFISYSLFQCISVADVCMLCLSYPVLGHDIALSNALRCIFSVS